MTKDRNGCIVADATGQDKMLALLYGSLWCRMLLKLLTWPPVSKAAGLFLSSRLSTALINPFIRKNHIRMEEFEEVAYHSYNEFFSRKIRPECRPIDPKKDHLIAPCDSKLTVLPISEECRFTLKHTVYTVESLLRNAELAKTYEGGWALIFRLTVDDYHRYCYVADGVKTENTRIPGVLHTVNPIANDHYPIYKENSREYSILHSDVFGEILMMEVGALLVGKIVNHHEKAQVARGQEKGYFQFGGSTVVLLLKKNVVVMDEDLLTHSQNHIETVVKMGEAIGHAAKI